MRLLVCTQVVDSNHPILGFFHGWLFEFSKHFDHIDVICFEAGEHSLPSHVHIHELGKRAGKSKFVQLVTFYSHFYRAYKSQPDYVFFHMGAIMNVLAAPFYIFTKLKRSRQTVFLWWKTHGRINIIGRLALNCVDQVITATIESFPINTKKKKVVGHAVDTIQFSCNLLEKKPTTLLYVGRVAPIKHLESFIDTAAALRAATPETTALIIGGADDVGYLQSLTVQAQKLGLSPDVFAGTRTQAELGNEYCQAQFFLNPSRTDSMDKTVLEAMACGVVPLTANRAFKDMLEPLGLYHSENNPEWYADRIQVLLHEDTTELRQKLRAIVVEHHSIGTLTKRIFNV